MNKDVFMLMTMDIALKICQSKNMKFKTPPKNIMYKCSWMLFGYMKTPLQIDIDTYIQNNHSNNDMKLLFATFYLFTFSYDI